MQQPKRKTTSQKNSVTQRHLPSLGLVSEIIPDAVISIDKKGEIIFWNPFAEKLFGFSKGEIIGKNITVLLPIKYREKHKKGLGNYLKTGKRKLIGQTVEFNGLKKSGEEFPIQLTLFSWKENDEYFFTGIIRDISQLNKTKKELLTSEKKYRSLFKYANDAIYLIDSKTQKIIDCNNYASKIDGYSLTELKGMMIEDLHPENERPILPDKFREVEKTGSGVGITDLHHQRKDGRLVPIEVNASIIELEGKPVNLSIVRDVTKSKKEEAALRQSEDRFKMLSEAAFEAIIITKKGKTITTNKAFSDLFGYSPDEVIGMNATDFTSPEDRDLVVRKIKSEYAEPYDVKLIRKNGSTFFGRVRGKKMIYLGEKVRLTAVQDISQQIKATEELRQSEEQLSLLIEGITDYAMFMLDRDGNITSWNSGAQKLKGYKHDEIIGKHFSVFYPLKAIKNNDPLKELILAEKLGSYETQGWRVRKDGSRFWADVLITAVREKGGALRGFSKVTRDITDRKKSEEALRQKDKDIRKAYSDVFGAVTNGKLLILTQEEISEVYGRPIGDPIYISSFEQLSDSREFLSDALSITDIDDDNLDNMVLASGEAVANGVKHAGACEIQVYILEDETVQVRVSDHGRGIDFGELPKATLLAGFSTKKSLGMGFQVILEICDRVLLSTGSEGTTLLLEMGGQKTANTLDDVLSRGLLKE